MSDESYCSSLPPPPNQKNGKKSFKEQAMSLRKRFMQHYPFLVPCYARLSCLVVLCTSIYLYRKLMLFLSNLISKK